MLYGFYRGGFGDLYKLEPGKYCGVRVINVSAGSESVQLVADVQAQIDKGWLVKVSVSDLGSDSN